MNPEQTPNTPVTNPNPTPAPAPVNPTPAVSQKKKFPTWLKVLIGIVGAVIILVIALIVVVSVATAAPEKVSNQAVDDIQAGNSSALYAIASPGFKSATSEAALETALTNTAPLVTGEEKLVGKKVATSNGVEAAAFIYSVDVSGDTNYLKVIVQKSGDEWLIQGFSAYDEKPTLDLTLS